MNPVSPDARTVDQALMDRPGNADIQLDMLYDYRTNPPLYPQWQAYFRAHKPPTLIVWGKNDEIFPPAGACDTNAICRTSNSLDRYGPLCARNQWPGDCGVHSRLLGSCRTRRLDRSPSPGVAGSPPPRCRPPYLHPPKHWRKLIKTRRS